MKKERRRKEEDREEELSLLGCEKMPGEGRRTALRSRIT